MMVGRRSFPFRDGKFQGRTGKLSGSRFDELLDICMFEFCDSTQRIQLQVPFTPNPGGFFKVSGCLFTDGALY